MASRFSEEDFSCPVCRDIFKDPVLLLCSHSFCQMCLQQFWEIKGVRECPVCRKRSSQENLPLNLHLRNLCETFQRDRSRKEPFCSLHHSELKLFCKNDKQLLCLVCRDSKLHKKHNFSPISEATLDFKDDLRIKMRLLQKKLTDYKQVKRSCDQTAEYIKVKFSDTERQIKEDFQRLHQFLRDDEAARIAALREEEKQKSQMMKEKIEKMNREIASLSDSIRFVHEKMGADDVLFLQNYKSTVERAQCTLQDPERVSEGALINVAKHLGNLTFRVWAKMQGVVQYTPLILDPNTASPQLILSECLTSVRFSVKGTQHPRPNINLDSPGLSVLASGGFSAGTHCWDVEVGDRGGTWALGVKTESGQRRWMDCTNRSWSMEYSKHGYKARSPSQPIAVLAVERKPQRIRVQLDRDRGKLSFVDPDQNTNLHSFTHAFTGELIPFFSTSSSLRILPVKATVTVDQFRAFHCMFHTRQHKADEESHVLHDLANPSRNKQQDPVAQDLERRSSREKKPASVNRTQAQPKPSDCPPCDVCLGGRAVIKCITCNDQFCQLCVRHHYSNMPGHQLQNLIQFTSVRSDSVSLSWPPTQDTSDRQKFKVTWARGPDQRSLVVTRPGMDVTDILPGEKYIFNVAIINEDGDLKPYATGCIDTDFVKQRTV
ncbi:E3 ubiquitin-protein ligase TRIM35-like [Sardina pilchardus]|uniref:E3 ubiquitin-protein ligase TRIM35-like n=1 Tax=Sardina pilchardus TaxID=27697 RepID=UPI002E0D9220